MISYIWAIAFSYVHQLSVGYTLRCCALENVALQVGSYNEDILLQRTPFHVSCYWKRSWFKQTNSNRH